MNLMIIDAKERFYNKLKGIADPELERKIIGEEFTRVFEGVAERAGAEYLKRNNLSGQNRIGLQKVL